MQFSRVCRFLAIFALVFSVATPSMAHGFMIGAIRIGHPAAPATLPGQTSAVVYLTIENQGSTADRLVALDSSAAQNVVVHRMTMNGPVMAMREIEDLPLAPQTKIMLIKGSDYHVMLTGLKRPLVLEDRFPLALTFERAGKIEVMVNVERSMAATTTGPKNVAGNDNKGDEAATSHHH